MNIELSDFTRMFASLNSLDIARWRFEPGMCHGDMYAWWGQKARRKKIHQGIDFARYETSNGSVMHLEAYMRVPLPNSGTFVGIMEDFLGHTVVVKHGTENNRLIISLYGHGNPMEGLLGSTLDAGSIIAELSHPGKIPVPPHLHLGLALVPIGTIIETLSWDYIETAEDIKFIDPMELF